jgi:hypothetical protein
MYALLLSLIMALGIGAASCGGDGGDKSSSKDNKTSGDTSAGERWPAGFKQQVLEGCRTTDAGSRVTSTGEDFCTCIINYTEKHFTVDEISADSALQKKAGADAVTSGACV